MFSLRVLFLNVNENFLSNQSNFTNASCPQPNPIKWVHIVFNQCIYNSKEEIGFLLGLISILCWICASLPQLYENYKNGKMDEAISFWFLLFWLLGDSSNLAGCILTKQFPIQLYTAVYYVMMDLVMIFQFAYYTRKMIFSRLSSGHGGVNTSAEANGTKTAAVLCCMILHALMPYALVQLKRDASFEIENSHVRVGRTLLSLDKNPSLIRWTPEVAIGYAIGCFSSAFYLGSRVPQLVKNYRRSATDGVSPSMFILAVAGNLLYGCSILLQGPGRGQTWSQFLLVHLPWLIGSLGTLALDFTILNQIIYYSGKCCPRRITPVSIADDDESDADNNPLIV